MRSVRSSLFSPKDKAFSFERWNFNFGHRDCPTRLKENRVGKRATRISYQSRINDTARGRSDVNKRRRYPHRTDPRFLHTLGNRCSFIAASHARSVVMCRTPRDYYFSEDKQERRREYPARNPVQPFSHGRFSEGIVEVQCTTINRAIVKKIAE